MCVCEATSTEGNAFHSLLGRKRDRELREGGKGGAPSMS